MTTINYKNKTILLFLLLIPSLVVWGKPRSKQEISQIATAVLAEYGHKTAKIKGSMSLQPITKLAQTKAYTVMGANDGAFAVISNDDLLPEVLGYSSHRFSATNKPEGLQWWLKAVDEAAEQILKSGRSLAAIAPDTTIYANHVDSLIKTLWGQDTPFNDQCPIGASAYGEPERCVTGCVATTMAQVMYYHRYPVSGHGVRTIYYPFKNTSGTRITVNFSATEYDWDDMLKYYGNGYTEEQGRAVAELMLSCGVAVNMQYSTSGSGAYSRDITTALRSYFGYPETMSYLQRSNYDDDDWMNLVYKELNAGRPILYGGVDDMYGGHSFIIDGYDNSGLVHVNWGWKGAANGYYDISILNPRRYHFSSSQDMVIGVQGRAQGEHNEDITLAEAGTLGQQIADSTKLKTTSLKVSGPINGTDLAVIRNMAGRDTNGSNTGGTLAKLDLSDARFVAGGDAYFYLGNQPLTTTDDCLPSLAFYGCEMLTNVKLPTTLKHIGQNPFALCIGLRNTNLTGGEGKDFIVFDNMICSTDTSRLMAVLPLAQDTISVPTSVKTIDDYALAGCANITDLILPESLTNLGQKSLYACYNLNSIKTYARAVPTTATDALTDVPVTSCRLYVRPGMKQAFEKDPAWSKFVGSLDVLNQYDNIVEFGTSIKVRNMVREYGDENPEFGYAVSGDAVHGDPIIKCEATPLSPIGRYPVSISRGSIQEEDVVLADGFLAVVPATLTASVGNYKRYVGEDNPAFIVNLDGFKNGETTTVLTQKPVATTTATKDSPVGTYPITVSGGKANNYYFEYVAGELTIEDNPTGISNITNNGVKLPVYNQIGIKISDGLNLQEFQSLPKGIYIYGNKKVVKE